MLGFAPLAAIGGPAAAAPRGLFCFRQGTPLFYVNFAWPDAVVLFGRQD